MTIEEERVRQRIQESFDDAIEMCMGAIYSYLAEFDELHIISRSEQLSKRISGICNAQAKKTYDIMKEYLLTLCEQHPSLIDDKKYPILQTLIDNHARIANQIVVKAQQRKAQDEEDYDIADFVRDYMYRAFRHASDAVLFYEITRITVDETLAEAPKGAYFRVVCVHDDKTCPICLGIEANQAKHPVPVKEKLTGVNAPPFHPFCRCRVEVIS